LDIATRGRDRLGVGPASAAAVSDRDFVPDAAWFAAARPAFGEASLALGIGPLEFLLEGLSAAQAARLRDLHRPFVLPRASRSTVTVRFRRAGVDGFLALPAGRAENYRMERRERALGHDLWSYEFAMTAGSDWSVAELALAADRGPVFDRGLENALRVLTARAILGFGGLLLHGAGVVHGGRAHVFFGPSGAGKTTVTTFSPRDLVLSDDLTLIVPSGGGFVACGHPFGMAHHRVPDTRDAFPIAGLYRLVQAPFVRREALERPRALGEVAACLPFVMQDPADAGRALENAIALLRAVPASRLSFRKDDAFWGAIEEESRS
jgi:hypothetical protein